MAKIVAATASQPLMHPRWIAAFGLWFRKSQLPHQGFAQFRLGPSTMVLRPRDHFVSMRPWHEAKRKGALKLVEALKAKGAPINGVGLQHHVDMDWPTLNEIDTAISEECRCKRQVQPVSQRTPRFRSTDTGEALRRFVCHLCEASRCSDAGHVVGRHGQELMEERLAG